jgi:hypothetical protein
MPRRTSTHTKEFLIKAPLPDHANTYTVIPHEFVIKRTLEQLAANGFAVERELYRCNLSGEVASGVYHLHYGNDPDIGMMFAWSNSYDKSMRFKCAIGGYVKISNSTIIDGDMGLWGRKHTGSADNEAHETIQQQIADAENRFSGILRTKQVMKSITLSKKSCAELAGRLYMEHNILTGEQLTIVKGQMKNPKFDYNAPADSMWTFYNHITYALQKAHPRNWMDHQRLVHWFFNMEYGLDTTAVQEGPVDIEPELKARLSLTETETISGQTVADGQMDLEQMISEVEQEDKREKEISDLMETLPADPAQDEDDDEFIAKSDNGIPEPPPIDL